MGIIKILTKTYFSIIGFVRAKSLKTNVAYKSKYREHVVFHFIGKYNHVTHFVFDRYNVVNSSVEVTETNTTQYDTYWKLGVMRFKKI